MGQKDRAEKYLENYNDVFADLFNVLLFQKKWVPVITIILNFSRTEWKTPLSLKDMFHLSEDLDPFVQDYKIHVFNIAFLPKEVRNRFTSDFKIVADYFAERDNPDYQPDTQAIKHVEAVLEMFRVFTDDMRYDMIKSDVIEKRRKGGEVTMCTFVDRMVNLGIEQGIEQGEKRGMERGIKRGEKRGMGRGIKRGEKRGMKRGLVQGTARGKMEVLVHQITKKWNRNQSVPEIAEALEEEEVRVERIVELLEEYGSENMKKVVTKALKDNLIPLEKSVI